MKKEVKLNLPSGVTNKVGDWIFLAERGNGDTTEEAATVCFERLKQKLEKLGSSMDHIVQTTTIILNNDDIKTITEVKKKYVSLEKWPTGVGVIGSLYTKPGEKPTRLEMQVVAVTKKGKLKKEVIKDIPSTAVNKVGDWIFISDFARSDSIENAARACFDRLKERLEKLGSSMDDVVQSTTYFAKNEGIHTGVIVKKNYVSPDKSPIAVGVQAGLFFKPDVAPLQLETQVVALVKNGQLKKETIVDGTSRAIKVEDFIFLVEYARSATIEEAAKICYDRLKVRLEKLGSSINNVVQITAYYNEKESVPKTIELRKKYIPADRMPATMDVQTPLYIPPEPPPVQLEMQVIAVTGK